MADGIASNNDIAVRKRKTHRKSRLGCGNCKIRSVKCDESKPTCRRCQASGFTCSYSGTGPTLQLSRSSVFRLSLAPTQAIPASTSIHGLCREAHLQPGLRIPIVLPLQGRLGEYALRPEDHAALSRFYGRTASSLGTPTMRDGYFKAVHNLVAEHAFLIHILLAITLLHDTHLSQDPLPPSHSQSLAFHWYHSTAILKHFLALPSPATTLSSTHRDALWVCASILGATSFASIRTQDPLAAWPLADPNPAVDLDWLKMGYGKKVVWDIANPSRPESVFHNILHNTPMQQHIDRSAPISPGVFSPFFYSFFGLSTPTSSSDTNPYHRACVILSILWPNTINEDNAILFLTFITHIDPTYRSLLEEKDPRALLLLLFWHCLVVPLENWWLRRRCVVEAKAICMYLDKYCADDEGIIKMLEMPKEVLANSC
ncbi:uncharacterized protein TrAFT101_011869 [Trichoderma asperellum]|uniref:Zn(2)-C6 fungal-type domain-containing protein n=1 Tax=Trichoderma asperellum (strain ATCC 204424 / CBS 433.97 / NBRC 101777) TaxID=1042311 RepID=A0A2T3YZU6_TRIA4|nr:hypothetical protein M441DRAFT_147406 [Trichoderma asperellum CBS 433.97]PTB38024.1 hypothetical protein M441DRAFT_147406 [Trichoderma asperellum CBS 433.97]UKZ97101.1 hypothetical protein TrAFT101_011869 [Trichoderma asperellum]